MSVAGTSLGWSCYIFTCFGPRWQFVLPSRRWTASLAGSSTSLVPSTRLIFALERVSAAACATFQALSHTLTILHMFLLSLNIRIALFFWILGGSEIAEELKASPPVIQVDVVRKKAQETVPEGSYLLTFLYPDGGQLERVPRRCVQNPHERFS